MSETSGPHLYYEITEKNTSEFCQKLLLEQQEIENLQYFHQHLNRTEAEDIIERHAKQPGLFLLRWSSLPNQIAITSVVCTNRIAHAVIFAKRDSYYIEEETRFASIDSLVQYYKLIAIPAFAKYNPEARLTRPYTKFPSTSRDRLMQSMNVNYRPRSWQHKYQCTDNGFSVRNLNLAYKNEQSPGLHSFLDDGQLMSLPSPPPLPERRSFLAEDVTDPKSLVITSKRSHYLTTKDQRSSASATGRSIPRRQNGRIK